MMRSVRMIPSLLYRDQRVILLHRFVTYFRNSSLPVYFKTKML